MLVALVSSWSASAIVNRLLLHETKLYLAKNGDLSPSLPNPPLVKLSN